MAKRRKKMEIQDSGRVKAEVESIRKIEEFREKILPPEIQSVAEKVRPRVKEMAEEAPEWVEFASAQSHILSRWSDSARMLGGILAQETTCSGTSVNAGGDVRYYYAEPRAAYSPENYKDRYGHYPKINKTDGTTTQTVLAQDQLGRARGPMGWSDDKNLVGAALASFKHNFIQHIAAFFDRPCMPNNKNWELPNAVLPETKKPDQYVPPASYNFKHIRPAMIRTYTITTQAKGSSPIKYGLQWWDSNKNRLAKIDEIKVPEGRSRVKARVIGAPLASRTGYMNLEPIDAPNGLTVESVDMRPMGIC